MESEAKLHPPLLSSFNNKSNGNSYDHGEVFILNKVAQASVISSVILVAVAANTLVIQNICASSRKSKEIHFVLVSSICLLFIYL